MLENFKNDPRLVAHQETINRVLGTSIVRLNEEPDWFRWACGNWHAEIDQFVVTGSSIAGKWTGWALVHYGPRTLSLTQNRLKVTIVKIEILSHSEAGVHAIDCRTYNSSRIACSFANRVESSKRCAFISLRVAWDLNRGTCSCLKAKLTLMNSNSKRKKCSDI